MRKILCDVFVTLKKCQMNSRWRAHLVYLKRKILCSWSIQKLDSSRFVLFSKIRKYKFLLSLLINFKSSYYTYLPIYQILWLIKPYWMEQLLAQFHMVCVLFSNICTLLHSKIHTATAWVTTLSFRWIKLFFLPYSRFFFFTQVSETISFWLRSRQPTGNCTSWGAKEKKKKKFPDAFSSAPPAWNTTCW